MLSNPTPRPGPFSLLPRRATAAVAVSLALVASASANEDFTHLQTLETDNAPFNGLMGTNMGFDGTQVLSGITMDSNPASGSGSVVVYEPQGGSWVEVTRLAVGDQAANDWMGSCIALDGDTLVVGANGKDSQRGAVYVFERSGGVWSEVQKLTASDSYVGQYFGTTADLDGDTLVVGAPDFFNGGGRAYVFERVGGVWSETIKLTEAIDPFDDYARHVAVDGDSILISAANDDTLAQESGAVYTYRRSGGNWLPESKLTPPASLMNTFFGSDLELNENRAFIAARLDGSGPDGLVYVLERQGGAWVETQVVRASDASGPSGFGLGLHYGEGELSVGDPAGSGSGAVYSFAEGAAGFVETGRFVSGDSLAGSFGVSILRVGETYAIGAPFYENGTTDEGAIYLFERELWDSVCAGDGSGAACPCSNESAPGSGEGCANSTANGAFLYATGGRSVALDSLVIRVEQLPAKQYAVVVAGLQAGQLPFGDGQGCVVGNLVQFSTQSSGSAGVLTQPQVLSLGGFAPSDTVIFQAWYRDTIGSPCGARFNASNAIQVTLCP